MISRWPLICIYSIINEVEHLFICISHLYFHFCEVPDYTLGHFFYIYNFSVFFSAVFWSSLNWEISSLWYELQIFSHFVTFIFPFFFFLSQLVTSFSTWHVQPWAVSHHHTALIIQTHWGLPTCQVHGLSRFHPLCHVISRGSVPGLREHSL